MNSLERSIYNLVRGNPRIKNTVRNLYQRSFDLLPSPKSRAAYPIHCRTGHFFGFHDHTPFSAANDKLLSCRFNIPLRMPKLGESLEIGYFDGEDFNSYHPVTETKAWLWHLGCKLQWRGEFNQIVFNDHKAGRNIARVYDLDTGNDTELPCSIGSVSPDGRWAAGYSFARVAKCMPGYGYHYDVGDAEIDSDAPRHNGIHLIDVNTGKAEMLYSVSELANIEPDPSMKDALHYVTHAVFNPASTRFIFLHRWIKRNGDVSKRWSRMFSLDIEGRDLHLFPTTGMVSHIGWRGSDHVLAYCRVRDYDDQYVLFKDQAQDQYSIVGLGQFSSDGHPSFDKSGRWMITDSYPDRRRRQNLILFDTMNNARYDLAQLVMPEKFQSPSSYQHWACDLHPRWDRKGRYICFDATYLGERGLCTIDLGDDLFEGKPRHL